MTNSYDQFATINHADSRDDKFMPGLVDKLYATFKVFMDRFVSIYGQLPDTYLTIDLETTGNQSADDYIVQIGHCFVRDRQIIDRNSFYLDWSYSSVHNGEVKRRLTELNKLLLDKDPARNIITPEILHTQGSDPKTILTHYKDWIEELHEESIPLVTHNGCLFDMAFLYQHFVRFLGDPEWAVRNDLVFDTGAMVKAAQLDEPVFYPNEDLFTMAVRINTLRRKGVRWSLSDFVVPGLCFDEKYNLDKKNSHHAGHDAYVVHLLFEYLRTTLVSNPGSD